MENAGLDDPLTEAGVCYAAHTTDTMLDGKAYYRAVRGHQLYGTSIGKCLDYGWLTMVIAMKWMSKQIARNVAKVFHKSDGNCRAERCETVDKL